ncbi:MAG TPA: chloride channel protein [Tepidisphaeraceae bacterium]|nr:chloride channel protein [Tepidisphaeraceae bacterium]
MVHDVETASTTEGLPISPSMGPALQQIGAPARLSLVDGRVVYLCVLSIVIALAAAIIAELLIHLIALVTNLSFYGRISMLPVAPSTERLRWLVVFIPVIGGVIVGIMARYGSAAIRGHGIPEAMEQVLLNQSRIPARMTFLKPLSAAIAIGTGGPFGAEGPIIATGGALGSLVGQLLSTTASERKTLLAAGAAAGMAATFGSPVSAVLLAVELLLFEFRPRSIIPVALASATAAATRIAFHGIEPMFKMPDLGQPTGEAITAYILLGAVMGIASVLVTRAVYAIEDAFEHIPLHWMWWPAIGAVAVGAVGYFMPRTLGVGYGNISDVLSSNLTLQLVAMLCVLKFISWSISLGSGTSGGTLAPLFTIGGAIGFLLAAGAAHLFPQAGIDPRIGALVGMAAIFAGASRAMLASAVFAFETTLQPVGLLPLLGGCSASFLISCLLMRNSIMTEKIARRGVRVPSEYSADFLDQVLVRDACAKDPITLPGSRLLGDVRQWINSAAPGTTHQGFPVMEDGQILAGIVTRRDLLDPAQPDDRAIRELVKRPPIVVYDDCTLRDAADHMVNHDIGRLPVIARKKSGKLVGIITRSDLLKAHRMRLHQTHHAERSIGIMTSRTEPGA